MPKGCSSGTCRAHFVNYVVRARNAGSFYCMTNYSAFSVKSSMRFAIDPLKAFVPKVSSKQTVQFACNVRM